MSVSVKDVSQLTHEGEMAAYLLAEMGQAGHMVVRFCRQSSDAFIEGAISRAQQLVVGLPLLAWVPLAEPGRVPSAITGVKCVISDALSTDWDEEAYTKVLMRAAGVPSGLAKKMAEDIVTSDADSGSMMLDVIDFLPILGVGRGSHVTDFLTGLASELIDRALDFIGYSGSKDTLYELTRLGDALYEARSRRAICMYEAQYEDYAAIMSEPDERKRQQALNAAAQRGFIARVITKFKNLWASSGSDLLLPGGPLTGVIPPSRQLAESGGVMSGFTNPPSGTADTPMLLSTLTSTHAALREYMALARSPGLIGPGPFIATYETGGPFGNLARAIDRAAGTKLAETGDALDTAVDTGREVVGSLTGGGGSGYGSPPPAGGGRGTPPGPTQIGPPPAGTGTPRQTTRVTTAPPIVKASAARGGRTLSSFIRTLDGLPEDPTPRVSGETSTNPSPSGAGSTTAADDFQTFFAPDAFTLDLSEYGGPNLALGPRPGIVMSTAVAPYVAALATNSPTPPPRTEVDQVALALAQDLLAFLRK